MTKLEAVIFDLDDTLYPEHAFVRSGFQAVAIWSEVHLGIPQMQGLAELTDLFDAGYRGNTFDIWLEKHGRRHDGVVADLVKVYREHIPTIAPYPEAITLLSRLKKGYKLGLISDGYLAVQRRKFGSLALADYFDVVVFSDEWGRDAWKPDCRPFAEALERLGVVAPSRTVYVGDNPRKDFYGARQLGMKTIRFRHSGGVYFGEEPASVDYAPDVSVFSLDNVIAAINDFEASLVKIKELSR